jgi:hypothetical protein
MEELPIFPQKIGNNVTEETILRREKIAKMMALTGIDNTRRRVKSLAEENKVSTRTIFRDINWVVGHWKPENLREIKINLKIGRERVLQEAMELINTSTDSKEKVQAIQALNQTLKLYREELEAWGEKAKIADKQDVNITGYKFELIRSEKPKI